MKRLYFLFAALCLSDAASHAFPIEETAEDSTRVKDIEEVVIVSSPKETSKLRHAPIAVSLFGKNTLDNLHTASLKELSAFVPNFYMPDYGSSLTSAAYIRGVGSRINTPAVGLYVDNVGYADKSAYDIELLDVERVDVLRGPQAILYGRNAMGGIVNIYTISPFDFQGKRLSFSAGSYGQYKVKASHYGQLSEKIGFTAAMYYDHNDGFYTNAYDGKRVDKEDNVGGRIKLEGRFSVKWSVFTSRREYRECLIV